MDSKLIIKFENDKKLTFVDNNNPRYGFEVSFGDIDGVDSTSLSKDDRIKLIKFLVQSL